MAARGPWPAAGPAVVRPEPVVILGATAGRALFGSSFRVGEARGALLEREIHGRPEKLVATVHPSSVLRARDEEERASAYRGLVADPTVAAEALR